jgi:aspartate 1-decarboxylase
MILNFLKSKLHRATVTEANLHYEGSIAIDKDLMDAAGFLPYEKVDVLNITNGNRLTTYVIEGEAGSGMIGIQGAAAHLVRKNDLVIICAYCQIDEKDAKDYKAKNILLDENNKIQKII